MLTRSGQEQYFRLRIREDACQAPRRHVPGNPGPARGGFSTLGSLRNWTQPLAAPADGTAANTSPTCPRRRLQLTPANQTLGESAPRGPASTRPPDNEPQPPDGTYHTNKHQVTQESLGLRLPEHHRDDRVVVLVRPPPIHRRRGTTNHGAHRPQFPVREEAADRRLAAQRVTDRPRI